MRVEDYRAQDKAWASRLYGLSLVSEASIDLSESLGAFQFVCRFYNAQNSNREDRIEVLRGYPASLLAGLTAVASSRYDEGTFWPKVQEESGIQITQIHQSEFSDAFRNGLDRFGLSRFDTPQRNIGEILMHAGIPVPSMESFLRLLVERDARRADLTGEDFCSWVGDMPREMASSRGLDAPTWRFLKEGGAISSDLTERLLIFLDAAARRRQDLCDEAIQELPKHLGSEVHRLFESGRMASPRSRGGRARDQIPYLVYRDALVQLALPALESPVLGEHTWRFTTAGESWSRSLGSSWSYDRSFVAQEPIASPIADVVVSYPLLERDWKLSLIDRESPLLAFDYSTGKYLPSAYQLPQALVWLACPCDENTSPADAFEAEDQEGQKPIEIRELANTPTGWRGWAFILADLSNVKRIRPKSSSGSWRLVSSIKHPILRTPFDSEVPFTRTQLGSPVFRARPTLALPGPPENATDTTQVEWHVQTLDSNGEVVTSCSELVGTYGAEIDPWQGANSVLLGDYQVRAIGSLGRSVKFEIALAEGLDVCTTPYFRYIDRGGKLGAAIVNAQFDGRAHESRIEAEEISIEIPLSSGISSLTVIVTPPHMWISTSRSDATSHASVRPVLLEIDILPETTLRLHIGNAKQGTLSLVQDSSVVMKESLSGDASGVARVPLSRFYDTSVLSGGGDLFAQWSDDVSLIGRIRPKKLVSEIVLSDDTLLFARLYDNLDLQVSLRIENAPWLKLEPSRLSSGVTRISLPAPAQGRGPITVTVQPYDPWGTLFTTGQNTADAENQFRLDAGVDLTMDSLEDRCIQWIADRSPLPDERGAIEFLLDVYGSIRQIRPIERADRLAREIAGLTVKVGPRLFMVIAASQWSQASHTRLIVEGWAVSAKTLAYPLNGNIWMRSPYVGLLVSLGAIGREEEALELYDRLGAEARSILQDGCDPALRAGTFGDANIDLLAELPRERQDLVWRAYNVIPGRPLEEQQRAINARILFDKREDVRLEPLIREAPILVGEIAGILSDRYGDLPSVPLKARSAPKNWRLLPQVSLALAFAARLSARGSEAAEDMLRYARSWYADLADCAPAFVEQDLILAELWLTRWENS